MAHAAGEVFDLLVGFFREPDFFKPEIDFLVHFGAGHVVAEGDEVEVLADGEVFVHGWGVGCEADVAEGVAVLIEYGIEDSNFAAGEGLESAGGAEESGFAGAVGADEAEEISAAQGEGDIVDGDEGAECDGGLINRKKDSSVPRGGAHQ